MWLTSEEHTLGDMLQLCPEVVVGKFAAVTSIDSGVLRLTDEQTRAGWEFRDGVAYSPKIHSVEELPHDGYDEWYVFDARMDLGQVRKANVFDAPPKPGRLYVFTNYPAFLMHAPEMSGLVDIFWEQLQFIKPASFISDGCDFLSFVTSNADQFEGVRCALAPWASLET